MKRLKFGIYLLGMAIVSVVVLEVTGFFMSTRRSVTLATFAKVWSGRQDRAIDYRLTVDPTARYLLLVPPDYDPRKTYELWVTFHGIAGASEDAICEWYWYAKKRNVILLAPHGVHQIQNRKTPSLAYWKFDLDREACVEMIDEVSEQYNVDDKHVVLFGTSEGAILALAVASEIPSRISFIGLYGYDWNPEAEGFSAIDPVNLRKKASHISLFLGRGLTDKYFSAPAYAETTRTLRSVGFILKAMTWPGLGHDDRDYRDETLRFLDASRGHPQKEPTWSVSLSGTWKANFVRKIPHCDVCHDDSGVSKADLALTNPSFDDSSWEDVPIPMWRAKWKGDWSADKWSGETMIRRVVDIPTAQLGKDLTVNLALIESLDTTYFNGFQIGQTTVDDPYWLWKPRIYTVPAKLVHQGRNILAVRLFDRCGGGGITYAGPGELRITAD